MSLFAIAFVLLTRTFLAQFKSPTPAVTLVMKKKEVAPVTYTRTVKVFVVPPELGSDARTESVRVHWDDNSQPLWTPDLERLMKTTGCTDACKLGAEGGSHLGSILAVHVYHPTCGAPVNERTHGLRGWIGPFDWQLTPPQHGTVLFVRNSGRWTEDVSEADVRDLRNRFLDKPEPKLEDFQPPRASHLYPISTLAYMCSVL